MLGFEEEDFQQALYPQTSAKEKSSYELLQSTNQKIQDFSLALSSSKLDTDPNMLENHALLSSSIHQIQKSYEDLGSKI